MCSVLFLKGSTYETSQLASQHNPNAFFYSFEYEGRNSIYNYVFSGNLPPIPHGFNFYLTQKTKLSMNHNGTFYFRCCSR